MAEKAEFLKGLKEWEKSIKVLDNKLKNTNSVPLSYPPIRNFATISSTSGTITVPSQSKSEAQTQTQNQSQTSNPEEGLKFKDLGNAAFKNGNFQEAISYYTQSLNADPKNHVTLTNRAMAYLKLEKYTEAEKDCTEAIEIDKNNVKALWRRGIARREIGSLKSSNEDFKAALAIEPSNKSIIQELEKLQKLLSQEKPVSIPKPNETNQKKEPQKQESKQKQDNKVSQFKKEQQKEQPKEKPTEKPKEQPKEQPKLATQVERVQEIPQVKKSNKIQADKSKPQIQEISKKEKEKESRVDPFQAISNTTKKQKESIIGEIQEKNVDDIQSEEKIEEEKITPLKKPLIQEISSTENNTNKPTSSTQTKMEPKSELNETSKSTPQSQPKNRITPKNSFELEKEWKELKGNDKELFLLFQRIQYPNLPKVFGECLDAEKLSKTLQIIQDFSLGKEDALETIAFLKYFGSVKRFGMNLMFLTKSQKESVSKMFQGLFEKIEDPEEKKKLIPIAKLYNVTL